MEPDGARASRLGVVVGNQSQGCRDVKRLAYPHERSCPKQLLIRLDVACPPSDRRPSEQAGADRPATRKSIGDRTTDQREKRIDPLELAEHDPPHLLGIFRIGKLGDRLDDRISHRRHHLAIEVIQQCHGHQKQDKKPSACRTQVTLSR